MTPGLRQRITYVPLALVLPLLWVASEGEVAVKPLLWVAVAAVVVVGLWTAFHGGQPRGLDWIIAGLLGLAATHRLLLPGFPYGHDTIPHLWGLYGFYRAILDGNYLPRWIHHLGLGMPFLLFYPPLPSYLMLPFLALDLPVYDAFKYGLVAFSALSGLSMFYVVRRWTGDRRAALVAAGAYCFAPYHMLDTTYRAAMAEAAAMAVLPLFFFYAHLAIEAPSRQRIGVAAAWTALLTVTHPLSLSMAGTGMTIWAAARHGWRGHKALVRSLVVLALLGLWGIGLAGYYTVPVAAEGRYASIDLVLRHREHPKYYWGGLKPGQFLARRAWNTLQEAGTRGPGNEKSRMPFYLGLSLLGLLPLARHARTPKGLMAMTLGTLALTLYPLDIAFASFPPMTMLQFPWRFLSIATFGACALAGCATLRLLETVRGGWVERVVPGAVFALLVLDFFPYGGAPIWIKPYAGIYILSEKGIVPNPLPLRVDRLLFPPADSRIDLSLLRKAYSEYFTHDTRTAFYYFKRERGDERAALERAAVGLTIQPVSPDVQSPTPNVQAPPGSHGPDTGVEFTRATAWVRVKLDVLNPTPYAEFTPASGGPARALEFTRGGEWIRLKLPGEAGTLVVKEQWFPGWDGQVGEAPVEVGKTMDGLMAFELKTTDTGLLTLHFSRTRWDRLAGLLLTGLCLLALWGSRIEGSPRVKEITAPDKID